MTSKKALILSLGLFLLAGITLTVHFYRQGATPGKQANGNGLSSGQKYPRNRLITGELVARLTFTPDGRFLDVTHADHSGVRWQIDECQVVSTTPRRDGAILTSQASVKEMPNPDGMAKVELEDKSVIRVRIPRGFGMPCAGAVSPDKARLVLADERGKVCFFSVATGQPEGWLEPSLRTGVEGNFAPVETLASDDGRYVLTTLANGSSHLFDSSDMLELLVGFGLALESGGRPLWVNPHDVADADGRTDRVGGLFDPVMHGRWRSKPENFGRRSEREAIERARIGTGETPSYSRSRISSGVRLMAGVREDGTCDVWDIRTGKQLTTLTSKVWLDAWALRGAADPFCVFSPDEALLLTQHQERTVAVWQMPTGTLLGHLPGRVAAATFHPEGKTLCLDNRYWDAREVKPIFDTGNDVWLNYAFSRNGKRLALVRQQKVCVLEVPSGQTVADFPVPALRPFQTPAVAINSTGTTIAVANAGSNEVILWDVVSKTKLRTLSGHNTVIQTPEKGWAVYIHSLGFADQDRVLYSGSTDGAVLLWDVRRN